MLNKTNIPVKQQAMVNLNLFDVVVSFSQLSRTSAIFLKHAQASLLQKSQRTNFPEEIFSTPSFRLGRHVFHAVFWYFHTRSSKVVPNSFKKVNWALLNFNKSENGSFIIRASLSTPNLERKVGVQIKTFWSGSRCFHSLGVSVSQVLVWAHLWPLTPLSHLLPAYSPTCTFFLSSFPLPPLLFQD